jgi:hypothetical protein
MDKAGREQSAAAVADARAARPPAPGRHRRRRRLLTLAIAAALLLGAIRGATALIARHADGTAGHLIPVTGVLEDVTVLSARNIWALGGSCAFGCARQPQTIPALIAH